MKTLSKLFKISGNFSQRDSIWHDEDNAMIRAEWITGNIKKPAFVGEIAMTDDNFFCGYCTELYDENINELNKTRYLAGMMIKKFGRSQPGVAFFKLSNDHEQAPLLYLVNPTDLLPADAQAVGVWGAFLGPFKLSIPGFATITLEDERHDKADHARIERIFDQCDPNVNCNGHYLDNLPFYIEQITKMSETA